MAKPGDCVVIGKSSGAFDVCKILESGDRECRSNFTTFELARQFAYDWVDPVAAHVWHQPDEMKPDILKPDTMPWGFKES